MKTKNTPADIWRRVAVGEADECWPFLGSLTTRGYGTFCYAGNRRQAHRVTYELVRGPISDGLHLDHLCRNRRCCNPSHLEPVTSLENTRRSPTHNGAKTHCPQGHEYSGTNLRVYRGGRYCRECIRIDARKRKQRNRPQSKRDNGPGCPGPTN